MLYITMIMRKAFSSAALASATLLAGCGEAPIAKTNCWASAGTTVISSTKGASPDAEIVSRAETSGLDVIPCP